MMRVHRDHLVTVTLLLSCSLVVADRRGEYAATAADADGRRDRSFLTLDLSWKSWSRLPGNAPTSPSPVAAVRAIFSNATRALLPLAPFLIEAPMMATQAKLAWPWLCSNLPFAFVWPTPTTALLQPVRHPLEPAIPLRWRSDGCRRNDVRNGACPLTLHSRSSTATEIPPDGASKMRAEQPQRSTAIGRGISLTGSDGIEVDGLCTVRGSDESQALHHGGRREIGSANNANTGARSLRDTKPESEAIPCTRRSAVSALVPGLSVVTAGLGLTSGTGVAAAGEGEDRARRDGAQDFGTTAFTKKSYDGFADGYDDLDGGWAASAIGMENLRSELLSRATGRVLEVGVGTGLNLRHYRRDSVDEIVAIDLSPGMLRKASARSASLNMGGLVRLREMDVEGLDYPSDSFDTVVDTFSLCVFPDPSAALREMARVCKPTGRVLLLENSKSDFGPLAAYQDLTATYLAEKGGGKGCFWNQDVEALARGAGLRVTHSSSAFPGGLFRTLQCVPV